MGLLRRITDLLLGSDEPPERKRASVPQRHGPIRAGDTASYAGKEDILAGLEFVATLSLDTPLRVLERHRAVWEGPPEEAPEYGGPSEGIWVPKVHWDGVGLGAPEPGMMASEIGPIPSDGGDFLPFLKDFRRIVESDTSVDEKIARIRQMCAGAEAYNQIARKLSPDFPEWWFWGKFTEIPGVGEETARRLFHAGYRSREDLRQSQTDDLERVKGVGSRTAEAIREYLRKAVGEGS